MREETLTAEQFELETKTVLLRGGVCKYEAELRAREVTQYHFRQHMGNRTYWQKGRRRTGMPEEERKAIFLEWWTNRGEKDLCLQKGISRSTLSRIRKEGRERGWVPK